MVAYINPTQVRELREDQTKKRYTPSNLPMSESMREWVSTKTSTTIALQTAVSRLNTLYRVTSLSELEVFLSAYPNLFLVFQESYNAILGYFPTATLSLVLNVHSHDTNYYEAIIYIHSGKPYKEASDILKRFDEEWGFKLFDESGGLLTISLR